MQRIGLRQTLERPSDQKREPRDRSSHSRTALTLAQPQSLTLSLEQAPPAAPLFFSALNSLAVSCFVLLFFYIRPDAKFSFFFTSGRM
jgi:hypothetical protein